MEFELPRDRMSLRVICGFTIKVKQKSELNHREFFEINLIYGEKR